MQGPKWPLFYSRLDPKWSLCMVRTGYVLWVKLPVQGRLCPIFMSSVGLPDIHEYFRRLTGCQRTSGFWGVTAWYQSLGILVPRAWGTWA